MNGRFRWSDFIFPSTLQLSSYLSLLLEPVKSSDVFDKIHLGLHEALVNAVLHGNCSDPSKKLRVRRILTPNWLVWQVQDQGEGIPFKKRIFSLPDQLDSNRGRGLFLIHNCFDDIRWSQRGNRLQLAIRRDYEISDQDILDP